MPWRLHRGSALMIHLCVLFSGKHYLLRILVLGDLCSETLSLCAHELLAAVVSLIVCRWQIWPI